MPCKFNLIPFNPFPGTPYKRSPTPRIRQFSEILMAAGIVTTTRKTRGDDIDAACGQLAGQVKDKTRRIERRTINVYKNGGRMNVMGWRSLPDSGALRRVSVFGHGAGAKHRATARTAVLGEAEGRPHPAKLRTELAAPYFQAQEYIVALEELTPALSVNPDYAPAYSLRGLVLFNLKEFSAEGDFSVR